MGIFDFLSRKWHDIKPPTAPKNAVFGRGLQPEYSAPKGRTETRQVNAIKEESKMMCRYCKMAVNPVVHAEEYSYYDSSDGWISGIADRYYCPYCHKQITAY